MTLQSGGLTIETARFQELAASVAEWATACRRHLHAYPELSYQERETSEFIAAELRKIGYQPQTGIGGFGIKVVLQGGKGPGRTIALRADIDALPIQEQTGLPFASRKEGLMHACGHDVHTAVLLGTARALRELQPELTGQVVLIFQPGEESAPGGASLMIKDGVLENPHVDAIFGLHVLPSLTVGQMGFGDGPRMAAPDEFDLTIHGKGGHGAHPYATVDAVYVACQVVNALQSVVSRNINPFDPVVLTVGSIHSGNKHNIIPGEAVLQGTVRTMSQPVREQVLRRIQEVADGVCVAHGATATLEVRTGYPVLVNSPGETALARAAAATVLGEGNITDMAPSMGAEDFAFYLQERPGSFGRLGAAAPEDRERAGLHTPRLNLDEGCIPVGVAYYLSLVQDFLRCP
ncbi:MAG: N-acyl-L-amino acid amidohydrolase [Firmicutes bacterium]|nr:N-acyl-L-amino acid amidohydrolase [Bacillota bacterium]